MAFKKLKGCDSSDMGLWANRIEATNLIKEVEDRREQALSILIRAKNPNREESAAVVRAYNLVLGLFKEAREMK